MYQLTYIPKRCTLTATLLVTSLLLLTTAVSGYADEKTAHKFCVDVLKQSKYDATQCLLKPQGFQITLGKDQAVLTYLCCLGTFNDVTHNYMPYLSQDLIVYLANVESAANLINLGSFVDQCAGRSSKLTRRDFNYWNRMGRSVKFCKTPWVRK